MTTKGDRGDPDGSTPKKGEAGEKPKKPGRPVHARFYRYQVDKVFALRKLIRDAVGLEFLNRAPTAATFPRLVELVQEILPGSIDYKTLEDSLRHLAGVKLNAEMIDAAAWRMAGNYKRLAHRRAVPPWHVQTLPEWVPVQAVACRRERSAKGRLGARISFRILAGTPAGLTTETFWTLKFCRYMSSDFGFSRPRGNRRAVFPFSAPEQFVGLRLYVRVMPALSAQEPGFDGVGFPTALGAWNKTTLKCRFRAQPGFVCRMKVLHTQLPCHHCPVGFNKCRAATHREDWVEKPCPSCEKEDAFFDPESKSDVCVDCTVKSAYRGTK